MTVTPVDPFTGEPVGPTVDLDNATAPRRRGAPSVVDSSPVPSGSIAEVLAWAGDDPDRASAALAIELTRSKPRAGLVDALGSVA